ncbi:MAG TPA: hypothetical protein VF621_17440 [Pyrinomonadaceae bacterium]|jgi:hypothetical protein
MRTVFSLLCLLLLGAAAATAQTPPPPAAPPDLVVLQKKWQAYVRNPALDRDPFDANDDFADAQRQQKINDLQNKIRGRGNEALEPPPPRVKQNNDPPPPPGVFTTYVYKARVRNTGTKTVRVIDWGYTFLDPETRQELGRHLYTAKVKIRPGQDNELVGRSAKPQTGTVSVKNAGKELGEQVVIYRVEYEDGSVWQPARN